MALAEPVSPGLRKRRDVTIAGNDRLHEAHAGALHKRYAKQNDHVGTRLSDTAALVLTPRLRAAAVDVALSTALLVLAVAVRFYRLTYVDGIIFDEVRHANALFIRYDMPPSLPARNTSERPRTAMGASTTCTCL